MPASGLLSPEAGDTTSPGSLQGPPASSQRTRPITMLPTHLSRSDPSPACRTRAWGQWGPPALVAVLSSLLLSWCPALRTWCGPAHWSRGFASRGWWLFSRSVTSQPYATPWMAARQTSLPFTISWSLLRLMSTESVMPSNHLVQLSPPVCSPSHGCSFLFLNRGPCAGGRIPSSSMSCPTQLVLSGPRPGRRLGSQLCPGCIFCAHER